MNIVIFGLTISSSWGNGHVAIWRDLCRGLLARGHSIQFFEKDVPDYAQRRSLIDVDGLELVLYPHWDRVKDRAGVAASTADVAIVASDCPDARAAAEMTLQNSNVLKCFYDLDTPVTMLRLESGRDVEYIGPRGLRDFDLVLSSMGGEAITKLKTVLGAPEVLPLYSCHTADKRAQEIENILDVYLLTV